MKRLIITAAACFLVAGPQPAGAQNAVKAQQAKAGNVVANAPAKVDAKMVDAALAMFSSKDYVQAENDLRVVVNAIAADQSAANPLRRRLRECLEDLIYSEHQLGHDKQALTHSVQYQKFVIAQFPTDLSRLNDLLDKNALIHADILMALDHTGDAEQYIKARFAQEEPNRQGIPVSVLVLRAKLAELANAQDNDAESRMRWKRVIELGEQTIKRFDGKQLHDDEFSSCAESLARGYLATNQMSESAKSLCSAVRFSAKSPQGSTKCDGNKNDCCLALSEIGTIRSGP